MGRLIDADKLLENQYRIDDSATLSTRDVVDVEDIEDAPTVEAIPKTEYEARLKADMVAVLTDLSMKIGEIEDGYTEFDEESKRSLTMIPLESVERLIDREINSLKEKTI